MNQNKLFYNSFLEFEQFAREEKLTALKKVEYYKWCRKEIQNIIDQSRGDLELQELGEDVDHYPGLAQNKHLMDFRKNLTSKAPKSKKKLIAFVNEKIADLLTKYWSSILPQISREISFLEGKNTEANKHLDKKLDEIPKIQIKCSLADLTRIFEAMRDVGIISKKTEIKYIGNIFSEIEDFRNKYYSNKSKIKSGQNSTDDMIYDLIIKLIDNSYNKDSEKLEALQDYIKSIPLIKK